jgi:ABC-type multidrug transport system fused ATPase/permease subunit
MKDNLIIHLETIITLIIATVVFIGLPYITGLLLDKLLKITRIDHNHVVTWVLGVIILIIIGSIAFCIYSIYQDTFTYYTKH